MSSPTPICFIVNEIQFNQAVVSAFSLLVNWKSSRPPEVIFLTTFCDPQTIVTVEALGRRFRKATIRLIESPIQPVEIKPVLPTRLAENEAMQFFLGEILSEQDRALLLASDVIVQADLSELCSLELQGSYAAASVDSLAYDDRYYFAHYEEIVGVQLSQYFNSGVMLLNLARMREEKLAAKLVSFAESTRGLRFPAQDAFNHFFCGETKLLPREFNLMSELLTLPAYYLESDSIGATNALILRYNGKKKPWKTARTAWSKIYRGYYSRSPLKVQYKSLLRSLRKKRIKRTVMAPVHLIKSKLLHEVKLMGTRFRGILQRNQQQALHAFTRQTMLEELQLNSTKSGLYSGPFRGKRIVVSLTTIPARLFEIGTSIESMLHQTVPPDEIVLWLDQDGIDDEHLPMQLKQLQQRGLTVKYREDVGPHTKLWHALSEYQDDIIITVDDDILYPFHLIESLFLHYQKDPNKIYCTRARHISTLFTQEFSYGTNWPNLKEPVQGLNLLPLGVGGVLYPPGCFDDEVFNKSEMRRLTPKADDIWYKAMSLKKRTICEKVPCTLYEFPMRPYSQEVSLQATNVHGAQNERQIKACFDAYDLWDILLSEDRSK